jgi:hypothetical protein
MWQSIERKYREVNRQVLAPYASINRRFEIVINRTAHKMIDGANYVELHYDAESHRIGLKWPQMETDLHVYSSHAYGRGGRMRIFRARRFFRRFGIEIDHTITFRSLIREEGPMLILDLSTAEPLDLTHSSQRSQRKN